MPRNHQHLSRDGKHCPYCGLYVGANICECRVRRVRREMCLEQIEMLLKAETVKPGKDGDGI